MIIEWSTNRCIKLCFVLFFFWTMILINNRIVASISITYTYVCKICGALLNLNCVEYLDQYITVQKWATVPKFLAKILNIVGQNIASFCKKELWHQTFFFLYLFVGFEQFMVCWSKGTIARKSGNLMKNIVRLNTDKRFRIIR